MFYPGVHLKTMLVCVVATKLAAQLTRDQVEAGLGTIWLQRGLFAATDVPNGKNFERFGCVAVIDEVPNAPDQ